MVLLRVMYVFLTTACSGTAHRPSKLLWKPKSQMERPPSLKINHEIIIWKGENFTHESPPKKSFFTFFISIHFNFGIKIFPSVNQDLFISAGYKWKNNDITSKLWFLLAWSGCYPWFHFDSSFLVYQDQKPSWISQKAAYNDMLKASNYI